jgi:cyanuric acid amidohydrolase
MNALDEAPASRYRTDVFRLTMSGPGDVSGLLALCQSGALDPEHIVAIFGKTEGNGGVNDFTREYSCAALSAALAPLLKITPADVERRIAMVMSGGTEGVLTPHATIFARVPVAGNAGGGARRRLAIGVAATRDFVPWEIGRRAQIEQTAIAVRAAMRHAGIVRNEDVHWVQIKCPLLTAERVRAAQAEGHAVCTESGYKSMGYSRGASALGVALAMGEVDGGIADEAVLTDWSLASSVASTSAGIELLHNIVVVLGNSEDATGDCVIGHDVMRDAIDARAVLGALRDVGLGSVTDPLDFDPERIVNVLAKADPSPDGLVRGYRHTMLDDTDISATRHVRAAVGGIIAGLAGCPAIFVSGGAEHQGPPGGGPVAVIARARD